MLGPRRSALVATTALVFALGLQSGSVASAGTASVDRTSAALSVDGTVEAHGRTFEFELRVHTTPGSGAHEGSLYVALALARGSGDRLAEQEHSYRFGRLGAPWAHVRTDLSRGSLSSGSALGPWGRIHLTFTPDGPPIVRCGGTRVVQPARVGGSVSFTPQGDNGYFGTISSIDVTHASMRVSHGACGGVGGGRPACDTHSVFVEASDLSADQYTKILATRFRDSDRAFISLTHVQFGGSVEVYHVLDAFVPLADVRFRAHSATVVGARRAFMSGSASFEATDRAQNVGHHKCGHGSVESRTAYDGVLSGAAGSPLSVAFVTGAVSLPAAPDGVEGYLEKVRVQDR